MRTLSSSIALAFLIFLASAVAADEPLAITDIRGPESLDAALRGTWVVTIENRGSDAIDGVVLRFLTNAYPATGTVVEVSQGCVLTGGEATCTLSLAAGERRDLGFVAEYTAPYGHIGAVVRLGEAQRNGHVTLWRPFRVTSVNDDGPGSLRAAIASANRECGSDPCAIELRIDGPVPAEGWFTIRPLSPLPVITASYVRIDASTQTRHTGDSNPRGPEVMLDGSAAGFAHGLVFDGGELSVSDLAVGRFAGNGIESHAAGRTTLLRNHLGTDPTGLVAAPNGWRGAQVMRGGITIARNVLSGNRRSGAFLTVTESSGFSDNFVGVGSDGATPLSNGASGVFFEKGRDSWHYVETSGNVIGYNAHAGISLSRNAVGSFGANTFRHNAGLAIDIGMNGDSRAPVRGTPGRGGIIGAPQIVSATYDDGFTTIRIALAERIQSLAFAEAVHLYVNEIGREGGELLGTIDVAKTLELRVPGDLRGKYVSASTFTHHIHLWDDPAPGTSELSAPVQVR